MEETENDFGISRKLCEWYDVHKRDLPWRHSRDPYIIWISEIILQQTRVAQGLDYFNRFVERFPDIRSLAEASEDEVLKYWQGLGYYSRARNLHAAARFMAEHYDARFPQTYPEVRALKGIGDYTAAAIVSFAWNLPYAVVDGNVYRVLARFFGIDTPIDTGAGKKYFKPLWSWAPSSVYPKRQRAQHVRWQMRALPMRTNPYPFFPSNKDGQRRATVSSIISTLYIMVRLSYRNGRRMISGKDCTNSPLSRRTKHASGQNFPTQMNSTASSRVYRSGYSEA